MGGGFADEEFIDSLGFYYSVDGGITWSRPRCPPGVPCNAACAANPTGDSYCTLPEADPFGSCDNTTDWTQCYVLPDGEASSCSHYVLSTILTVGVVFD